MCELVKIFVRADVKSNRIKCNIVRSYAFQLCPDFCTTLHIGLYSLVMSVYFTTLLHKLKTI
jgi:hypothetical protein